MRNDEVYRHYVRNPKGKRTLKSVSHDGTYAYSYQMPLCFRGERDGRPYFIVNGDGSPSITTSRHQGELRSAVSHTEHSIIPFGALRAAGVKVESVHVIDTTDDQVIEGKPVTRVRNGVEDTYTPQHHFLGETYFKQLGGAVERHFVCGLDRNDNPRRRMFFLAELPKMDVTPKTVDEALESLRPEYVPPGTPRQGEWFFVPTKLPVSKRTYRLNKEAWLSQILCDAPWLATGDLDVIDVVFEKTRTAEVERWGRKDKVRQYAAIEPRDNAPRHYAAELVRINVVRNGVADQVVYVRGSVRDDEHDACQLSPKEWRLAVRNLAVRGWRAGDGGTRVD